MTIECLLVLGKRAGWTWISRDGDDGGDGRRKLVGVVLEALITRV